MSEVQSERVTADVTAQVNAGAALVHALYHSTAEVVTGLPTSVLRAYGQACAAYGVGQRHEEDRRG